MTDGISAFLLHLLEIVWVNILLSGDNAIVIALACRTLPVEQRKWGTILGAAGAVVLRIIFSIIIVAVLGLPLIKLLSGIALIWIAVSLVTTHVDEGNIKPGATLWAAVGTIVVADMIMSLDNVIAIAAAADGSLVLIVVGLVLSIPLIVFGANVMISLIDRFAWLLWAGVALLGWVGGQLAADDPVFDPIKIQNQTIWGGVAGAIIALALAGLLAWRRGKEAD